MKLTTKWFIEKINGESPILGIPCEMPREKDVKDLLDSGIPYSVLMEYKEKVKQKEKEKEKEPWEYVFFILMGAGLLLCIMMLVIGPPS